MVNLFVPNCSSALLSSGWNIIITAINPIFIIAVSIAFNILKFKNPLIHVATSNNAIPLISCHALDPFTIFTRQYNRNNTINISNIVVNNVNGFSLKF